MLFEGAGKMLAVVKAKLLGNFGNRQGSAAEQRQRKLHFQREIIAVGGSVVELFEQVGITKKVEV